MYQQKNAEVQRTFLDLKTQDTGVNKANKIIFCFRLRQSFQCFFTTSMAFLNLLVCDLGYYIIKQNGQKLTYFYEKVEKE